MSCWRTYTCDVLKDVDRELVLEALKEMNVGFDMSKTHVKDFYGSDSSDCDGVLVVNDQPINVGIVFNDKTNHLSLVGDFWNTGLDAMEFQDSLSQTYQKINIMYQAELNGWTVDEETMEITEDGSVEMEVYSYAFA